MIRVKAGKAVAQFGGKSPMGRPAQPEELAPSHVFLASDADSFYLTGISFRSWAAKPPEADPIDTTLAVRRVIFSPASPVQTSPSPASSFCDHLRVRRRRIRILIDMLRALSKPLVVTRQIRRLIGMAGPDLNLLGFVELLMRELAVAAKKLAKRLHALGVHRVRRPHSTKAASRLKRPCTTVTEWLRCLVRECRRCAARLCESFRAAQAVRDRASLNLAYGLLRTLEKEVFVLQSNHPSPR